MSVYARKLISMLVAVLLVFQTIAVYADNQGSGIPNPGDLNLPTVAQEPAEEDSEEPNDPVTDPTSQPDDGETAELPIYTPEEPESSLPVESPVEIPIDTPAESANVLIPGPTGLKSNVQSDTTINFEWLPAQDPTTIQSYEIYVNDGLSGTVSAEKLFYTITNLSPGITYSLKIRSLALDGTYSEFSEIIQVTTLSNKKVFEFESLVGGLLSGDRLTLPEENVSSAGYHAFYESNEIGDYIEFPFTAEAGTYQLDLRIKQFKNRGISQIYVDGASIGVPLDFYNQTARHIDIAIGEIVLDNRPSHTIRFEVTDKNTASTNYILGLDAMYLTKLTSAPAPAAPTKLQSGAQSDTTVNLNWTAPVQDPAVPIDSYEIYVDDVLSTTVPGTKTFYTVTGLTPGTTYSFKIRAISQNQRSEFSNIIQATTLTGKLVYEFENLEGVTHSGDKLSRLEENMSSGGLHAFYESNAAGDWIEFPFTAEAGTYQLDLRIRQFKNRGIARILVDGTPVSQGLDFYNLSSRHFEVAIGEIKLDNRSSHTIRFEVTDKNAASTSYILGLDAMYLTKKVVAAAPPTPINFKSGVQSDTTINLEWAMPTLNSGVLIKSYEIYMNDKLAATVSGEKTFYTIKALSPGTAYSFKIRALNQDQIPSEFSETITVSTLSGKLIYEFESLTGATHSGDKLSMLEESKSSAGLHAFYESNATGDYIEFPFTAEKGVYQLDLRIRQFKNRGIAKISIDGAPLAESLDFYNLTSRHIDVSIGKITLNTRETHTIRFEVIDKNAASTDYILGLDALYLTPMNADTFEPNNSPEAATQINVSQLYESYISHKLDLDYFKFTAVESDTYFMSFQAPKDSDFKIELLNDKQQPLMFKQNVNGLDRDISVYLAKGSTAYIKVSSANSDFSLEAYRFRISPSPLKQYVYDDANRLIRTEYEQGLYLYQIKYDYDRNGNLLMRQVIKNPIQP